MAEPDVRPPGASSPSAKSISGRRQYVCDELSKIEIIILLQFNECQWSVCRAALKDISIEEVEKDGKYVRIVNRSASKVLSIPVDKSVKKSKTCHMGEHS